MYALRVENEIHEGQGEQSLHLGERPIVTNGAERSWIHGVSRVRPIKSGRWRNRAEGIFASAAAAVNRGDVSRLTIG
jgi:hypothetical protein